MANGLMPIAHEDAGCTFGGSSEEFDCLLAKGVDDAGWHATPPAAARAPDSLAEQKCSTTADIAPPPAPD